MNFEFRPTPRIVQLIAGLERQIGHWERLSLYPAATSDAAFGAAATDAAAAIFTLDAPGSRAGGAVAPEQAARVAEELVFAANPQNSLAELYSRYLNQNGIRQSSISFALPRSGLQDDLLFPAVAPFLIGKRMSELLEWTDEQSRGGALHPAVIAGVFHLLFLQVSPLARLNHQSSLILTWKILVSNGHDYLKFRHFAVELLQRKELYPQLLRQAEKTVLAGWGTFNAWLDLFLDTLRESAAAANRRIEAGSREAELTGKQRDIIEAVRREGALTRERISQMTGIRLSTVKYNLTVLTRRGYLKPAGAGRTTSYRVY